MMATSTIKNYKDPNKLGFNITYLSVWLFGNHFHIGAVCQAAGRVASDLALRSGENAAEMAASAAIKAFKNNQTLQESKTTTMTFFFMLFQCQKKNGLQKPPFCPSKKRWVFSRPVLPPCCQTATRRKPPPGRPPGPAPQQGSQQQPGWQRPRRGKRRDWRSNPWSAWILRDQNIKPSWGWPTCSNFLKLCFVLFCWIQTKHHETLIFREILQVPCSHVFRRQSHEIMKPSCKNQICPWGWRSTSRS